PCYYTLSILLLLFLFSILRRPPLSTLFPFTTLFRSTSPTWTTARSSARRKPAWNCARTPINTSRCFARTRLRSAWSRSKKIRARSEEHTSELQSPCNLVCRLLLEKKNNKYYNDNKHK